MNAALLGVRRRRLAEIYRSIVKFSASTTSSTSRFAPTRAAWSCGSRSRSQSTSSRRFCSSTRCCRSATARFRRAASPGSASSGVREGRSYAPRTSSRRSKTSRPRGLARPRPHRAERPAPRGTRRLPGLRRGPGLSAIQRRQRRQQFEHLVGSAHHHARLAEQRRSSARRDWIRRRRLSSVSRDHVSAARCAASTSRLKNSGCTISSSRMLTMPM